MAEQTFLRNPSGTMTPYIVTERPNRPLITNTIAGVEITLPKGSIRCIYGKTWDGMNELEFKNMLGELIARLNFETREGMEAFRREFGTWEPRYWH